MTQEEIWKEAEAKFEDTHEFFSPFVQGANFALDHLSTAFPKRLGRSIYEGMYDMQATELHIRVNGRIILNPKDNWSYIQLPPEPEYRNEALRKLKESYPGFDDYWYDRLGLNKDLTPKRDFKR